MTYSAEITSRQGDPRETTDEGIFTTMQEAVDYLNRRAIFHSWICRAWINNREVRIKNRRVVVGEDGRPVYFDNRPINPATPAAAEKLAELPKYRAVYSTPTGACRIVRED
jgi:hypothetical protein